MPLYLVERRVYVLEVVTNDENFKTLSLYGFCVCAVWNAQPYLRATILWKQLCSRDCEEPAAGSTIHDEDDDDDDAELRDRESQFRKWKS